MAQRAPAGRRVRWAGARSRAADDEAIVTEMYPGVPGHPGHPGHLDLAGGTSIPVKDLVSVQVDVVGGRTLLTIPV